MSDCDSDDQRASISLRFIIVGGGTAGLSTAYTLKKAGHHVIVLEKSDGNYRATGSLQSPPNMTKLLYQWGLQAKFKEKAHVFNRFVFRNANTSEEIGSMIMNEEFVKDLVVDFHTVPCAALQEMLHGLAQEQGAEIRYNASIVEVRPEDASVRLSTGEILTADVIIGADGCDSTIRTIVTGDLDDYSLGRQLVVAFSVPAELLEDDAELQEILSLQNGIIWMGNGYAIFGHYINGGKEFTGTLKCGYDDSILTLSNEWMTTIPLRDYLLDWSNFEPRLERLLKLASITTARTAIYHPMPEDLVDSNSKVVLIGGAAHPILPGTSHGTALSLEDAQTLGVLFSRIHNRNQIAHFLSAYEEIRYPRISRSHEFQQTQWLTFSCPAGPAQAGRDAFLRHTMAFGDWDHMDEVTFKAVWGDELLFYAHDATEKVDDWWNQWGSFFGRVSNCEMVVSLSPQFQVSVHKGMPAGSGELQLHDDLEKHLNLS